MTLLHNSYRNFECETIWLTYHIASDCMFFPLASIRTISISSQSYILCRFEMYLSTFALIFSIRLSPFSLGVKNDHRMWHRSLSSFLLFLMFIKHWQTCLYSYLYNRIPICYQDASIHSWYRNINQWLLFCSISHLFVSLFSCTSMIIHLLNTLPMNNFFVLNWNIVVAVYYFICSNAWLFIFNHL